MEDLEAMSEEHEVRSRIATHFTFDNSDGNQETSTGQATAHETKMTVFQSILI